MESDHETDKGPPALKRDMKACRPSEVQMIQQATVI